MLAVELNTTAVECSPQGRMAVHIVNGKLNVFRTSHGEVVALRHFEELSNGECAAVLGLTKSAASDRYVRALVRLREALTGLDGKG